MTRSFPKLLALGAGFAVFAGMLGGGLMLARADDTPTPPTAPAATTPAPTKPKIDPKAVSDDFLQKLADNLKIDVATLKDALKKTGEDELQKLVDDGVLTQDQADKLKGMFENADGTFGFNLPFKLPFFGMHPGDKAPSGGAAPNGATRRPTTAPGPVAAASASRSWAWSRTTPSPASSASRRRPTRMSSRAGRLPPRSPGNTARRVTT